MSPLLQEAAEQAGITTVQAQIFMRVLRNFNHGMANAGGDLLIPPFTWPDNLVKEMREIYPGWENLTREQYNGTRAAVVWRSVCDYLISDDEFHEWEQNIWRHPVQIEQAVQETAK